MTATLYDLVFDIGVSLRPHFQNYVINHTIWLKPFLLIRLDKICFSHLESQKDSQKTRNKLCLGIRLMFPRSEILDPLSASRFQEISSATSAKSSLDVAFEK